MQRVLISSIIRPRFQFHLYKAPVNIAMSLKNTRTQVNGLLPACLYSTQSIFGPMIDTYTGWFRSLSETSMVAYGQQYFECIHDISGLPWWSSVVLSTVLVRTFITLPFSVYQNYILAKIENLQLEMPAIVKELKHETSIAVKQFKWTEQQAKAAYIRSLKTQWKLLIERDNCHPFKGTILVWVQLPLWICLSMALRNMTSMMPHADAAAHVLYLQLSLGGFLWIPNLIVPDSSLILPVLMALTNLSIIEIQAMARSNRPKSKTQNYITNFFRGLTILLIPIAATVPSCMSLYWTASSMCGLFCNLLLMSPKVRRLFHIPWTPQEQKNPYFHLKQQLEARIKRYRM